MDKHTKQTTMRFTAQDMEAIARIRELYGGISDTAAVRFALRLAARQETPAQALAKDSPFLPMREAQGSPGSDR
jgi:hypothetical protein